MLVPVYDTNGREIIGHIERDGPVCGKDFCDECGDCLHCYGDNDCPGGIIHRWLYYFGDLSPEDRGMVVRKQPDRE